MGKPDQTDPERFKKLPKPVDLEETVETSDVDPHAPMQDDLQENIWVTKHAGP